jgi:hypothetical protein
MRPSELTQAISKLQAALDNAENINLAFFARKLAKTASLYPEDQTIGQMALAVNRMNLGNKLNISRSEVKDLYRRLYSRNTKFAELFQEELGQVESLATPTLYQRPENTNEIDLSKEGDQVLLASLNAAMGNTKHAFTDKFANEAEKLVELECSFPKMVPEVETVGGNEECVICSASYATPKGKATFYVPVEIVQKKATIPSIFMGKTGPKEINKSNIEQYLEDFFVVKGSYGNLEVKSPNQELQISEVKNEEIETFAQTFDTPAGLAKFQFGTKAESGRKLISQKLCNLGKVSHQVSILNSDKNGITYGVSFDGLAFKVPVKIDANRLYEPGIILCQGSIEPFNAMGLKNLSDKAATDNAVAATVSPLFNLKGSDLVETVRQAVQEENYAKAEDALNVLANGNDPKAYQVAFSEYSNGLGMKKEAATEHKCSRMVKSSTSNQVLCGHLNLPLNKVWVDKNGNCNPEYRKAMSESYEGAAFMNSKIFCKDI